jgi:hypothetical protein
MKTRSALTALMIVAVLSACGSSKPAAKTSSSGESLSDFFGGGGDTPADSQARMVAQLRKGQEKVAACMRKEGFVYKPFLGNFTPSSSFVGPKAGEEVAWKRKHGYGMADSMSQSSKPTAQSTDPNQDIRSKLSKADQAAYDKAFTGFDPSHPPTGAVQPTGCIAEGFGGAGQVSQALQEQMSSKFEALAKRVQADPRVVALNRKWSVCMKAHGYTVSSDRDIFEKILGPEQAKVFPSSGGPVDGVTGTIAIAAGSSGPGTFAPPTISAAKIEALRVVELKVANADADCRSQSDTNKLSVVQKDYEKAFINENRDLLQKLKATQNG